MKNVLLAMLACIGLAVIYSCSSNVVEIHDEPFTFHENIVLQDYYTDEQGTALEKALAHIDCYNNENSIHAQRTIITFVLNIDDCPAKIIQLTEENSNEITQTITTNCRVNTSYIDDYIENPDYLSRHYTRTFLVSPQETQSTAIRKYSQNRWSDWTYYTDYHKASSIHAKNIAFFGGSFAHNLRDGEKGIDKFGFDYNGKTTSLINLVSDIFACRHIGNYAQGGQGVHTGMINNTRSFKYNMHEQIKYAIEFSKEKGYEYDVFLLFGGINDCGMKVPIGDIKDPAGDNSYISSFKKSIEYIRNNNPEAKIFLITSFPIFNKSKHYKSLKKYVNANLKLAKFYGLPILDIYNSKIFTDKNYTPYYMSDKMHPNGEGYNVISSYLIELLNR